MGRAIVIPAKAGTSPGWAAVLFRPEVPAFAGMTVKETE
jgi:hypothetical protein